MMKRVLAVLVVAVGTVRAQQVAATPPMGWNSWDAYGLTITEAQFRANVEVLKEHFQPEWNYAVIDEGWFFENPEDRGTPEKLHYEIDAFGRYVPVPERFPSAVSKGEIMDLPISSHGPGMLAATIENTSFRELGAWVHAQGLKFGIHIVRGIPRASAERNMPVEGSAFHAQDAADTSDACPWDPTNWGVKDNAAGQAWYDSLLRQYASWGVDLLKVDCIADHPYKVEEIRMIRRAINKTGRPMVLSLSPGPTNLSHAKEVGELANMWRISNDEWDVWDAKGQEFPQGVKDQFARLAAWEKYARPGNWPDADMLPLGELKPYPGWGDARTSRLTEDEQRTQLTLWAMARSPLIVGANLTLVQSSKTLAMLNNPDVIAVDQTSTENAEVLHEGDLIAWRAKLPNGDTALALFNTGDRAMKVNRKFSAFGLRSGPWNFREAWNSGPPAIQSRVAATLAPHACLLLMLRPAR